MPYQLDLSRGKNYYYAAVRATPTCLGCHARLRPGLREGDLLAVVKIEAGTEALAEGFHRYRALLMPVALGLAGGLMVGSFLILRFLVFSAHWRFHSKRPAAADLPS